MNNNLTVTKCSFTLNSLNINTSTQYSRVQCFKIGHIAFINGVIKINKAINTSATTFTILSISGFFSGNSLPSSISSFRFFDTLFGGRYLAIIRSVTGFSLSRNAPFAICRYRSLMKFSYRTVLSGVVEQCFFVDAL